MPVTVILPSLTTKERPFIHWKYHQCNIPKRERKVLYNLHLQDIVEKWLDVRQTIFCYSRPKTIFEYVTKSKLLGCKSCFWVWLTGRRTPKIHQNFSELCRVLVLLTRKRNNTPSSKTGTEQNRILPEPSTLFMSLTLTQTRNNLNLVFNRFPVIPAYIYTKENTEQQSAVVMITLQASFLQVTTHVQSPQLAPIIFCGLGAWSQQYHELRD